MVHKAYFKAYFNLKNISHICLELIELSDGLDRNVRIRIKSIPLKKLYNVIYVTMAVKLGTTMLPFYSYFVAVYCMLNHGLTMVLKGNG